MRELLFIVGCACILYGLWLIYIPACLIAGGGLLLALWHCLAVEAAEKSGDAAT